MYVCSYDIVDVIYQSGWTAQIAEQQTSGMTVQKWCEENEINPKTYYYHLRKLREKCVASATAIVPLAAPKQTAFFPCLQQNYIRKSARAEILNRLLNVSFFLCLIKKNDNFRTTKNASFLS